MDKLDLSSYKDSAEWRKVQRRISEKQQQLKNFLEATLKALEQANSISQKNNLQRQYKEKVERYNKEILELNQTAYKKWVDRLLLQWRDGQVKLLKKKFYELIPKEPYILRERVNYSTGPILIRPEEARKQADMLVETIVSTVYDKLKEGIDINGRLPLGGNTGNIASGVNMKGQVQCGDNGWASMIEDKCQKLMKDYVKQDRNTFLESWKNYSGWFLSFGQHNWLEFCIPGYSGKVIIDPWPSGGREIYAKKTYKNIKGTVKSIYPANANYPIDRSTLTGKKKK